MKVLIVDDEPWVLEGLRNMIDWGKYGFEVCGEALNGPDALRLIQEHKPQLVLTDINIPVMSGLELIAKLNEEMEKPPKFVILSGYDDFKYARTALQQRVIEYLLKPIDDEEIDGLLSRLSQMIRNETASDQSLGKQHSFAVNNLANRFIQGEYNEELENQAGSLMNVQGEAELLCILIESLHSAIELNQALHEYFPQGLACFFQDGAGRSCILLQSEAVSSDQLGTIATQLHKDLQEQQQEYIILAVSDRMTGLRSIRALYLQSLSVWKQKSHQQKSGVFYFSDLRKIKKQDDIQKVSFKQLLDKVKTNDTEYIEPAVREVFASFSENLLAIEVIHAEVANHELTICRLIADMNGDPDRIMTRLQTEYGNLGELSDYFILSKYVYSLYLHTAHYLSELQQQNEGNTIFNVIQYVDREYHKKLQLRDLAIHFHMNSTYLGQLFRKHSGQSFSGYLNEKRMEEAKSLLKRTQLKISDIAAQVGYSNTDYFIEKFRRMVGVVPSVYKNANKNKQP